MVIADLPTDGPQSRSGTLSQSMVIGLSMTKLERSQWLLEAFDLASRLSFGERSGDTSRMGDAALVQALELLPPDPT